MIVKREFHITSATHCAGRIRILINTLCGIALKDKIRHRSVATERKVDNITVSRGKLCHHVSVRAIGRIKRADRRRKSKKVSKTETRISHNSYLCFTDKIYKGSIIIGKVSDIRKHTRAACQGHFNVASYKRGKIIGAHALDSLAVNKYVSLDIDKRSEYRADLCPSILSAAKRICRYLCGINAIIKGIVCVEPLGEHLRSGYAILCHNLFNSIRGIGKLVFYNIELILIGNLRSRISYNALT